MFFSSHEWDVGLAKGVEHKIRLSDQRPFRERSRRIAPADIDDVRKHLQELLAAGIIKESRSPYASPIVIARKRNGAVRMCIDYRTLNTRTVPDQYTPDQALDCLTGSQWFSVLDLRSGYYQIAMANEDKEKTCFHYAHWVFTSLNEWLKESWELRLHFRDSWKKPSGI